MRLQQLTLHNFKGVRDFTIEPHGEDVQIYGDNGTGKTTLFDAFTWLLFDKDSQDRKDFAIKTISPDGEPIHNLEHEVQAVLDLEPGEIALRKVYSERWTKKRGSAAAEFTGHTTDHFVDGVPTSKREFDERVREIADESVFRLLTDPAFFNERLSWQQRRLILLDVCGDVADDAVIASSPELSPLPSMLGSRSIEDHRKVISARRAEINKELDRIPVRIDEAQRALPDLASDDTASLEAELTRLRDERNAKSEELARIQSGGQIAELSKRRVEIQSAIASARSRAQEAADEAIRAVRRRLVDMEAAEIAARNELERLEREQVQDADVIRRMEQELAAKRAEWRKEHDEPYDGPSIVDHPDDYASDVCPACGQPIPPEQIESARAHAEAELRARMERHNELKAARLDRIAADGRALAQSLDDLRDVCTQRVARIAAASAAANQASEALGASRAELLALQSAPTDVSDPDMLRLQEQADQLTAAIEALRAGNSDVMASVRADMARLDDQIASIQEQIALIESRSRGLARIDQLRAEESRLVAEFEALERQLYLMDQFTRAKVRLLEERINDRFRLPRFQLFRVLVNGAVEECCETLYDGVPYSALNHGSRINVGLDIIATLSAHYGRRAPIWIDNRESVTQVIPMPSQVISLIVSAPDARLRVEVGHFISVREAV